MYLCSQKRVINMKKEDKQQIIRDLSGKIENKVRGSHRGQVRTLVSFGLGGCYQVDGYNFWFNLDNTDFKPYLRPMSSMTEEEKKKYNKLLCWRSPKTVFDWLNGHHFDYRGLIKKGLALEAPKEMY